MSVTAKEIAEYLNLSTASVSVALNNKPGVSTQTRKRVLEVARELGYDFSCISKQGKMIGS
ncbi:MAG: helix-turn-helix domain-containing protein, partial [Galactobacillus timonensis]|nr:helix-turn-helix domain-containing protein [Galactobacillus timonensis]